MRVIVYPYYDELYSIVKNLNAYNSEIMSYTLVSPVSWKNKIKTDAKQNVSYDFMYELDQVDGVVISDNSNRKYMYYDLVYKMRESILKKKNVYCYTTLKENEINELRNLAKENDVIFYYYSNDCFYNRIDNIRQFQRQDSVVIGVGNLLNRMDNISVLSNIAHKYKLHGYSVLTIAINRTCALLGFEIFPSSIWNNELSFDEKIKYINFYINILQERYRPDIILIHFDRGMMRFSDTCIESSGVEAFITSQALYVDYFILSVPENIIDPEDIENLKNLFKYRFGFSIDALLIENIALNYSDTQENEKLVYEYADDEMVKRTINSIMEDDCLFFAKSDMSAYNDIVYDSIKKLSENVGSL